MDYKLTLTLPQTQFPMKASLTAREPQRLLAWERSNLYKKIKVSGKSKPKYILHDGPPYANGHIHSGHVLNKVLKDFVVKYKTLRGYFAPFVPGWDCHGLPVEHRLLKELKATKNDVDQVSFRKKAHDYALKWINIQREEFKRFGIFGEWEDPYITMDPRYEYWIVKSFYSIFNNGLIIKGKKPIYWCTECETALAEAEVEYEDLTSPSIYVQFPLNQKARDFGLDSAKPLYIIIWTTTPWTLPANRAIAVHPDFEYLLEEKDHEIMIIAADLRNSFHQETGLREGKILKKIKGRDLEHRTYKHVLNDDTLPVILSEYVTLDQGTGCVHTAPGHGQEDFHVGQRYNLDVFSPVDDRGCFTEEAGVMQGENVFKADPKIIDLLDKKGSLIHHESLSHSYPHCWRCKKPVIFRATSQWFISLEKGNLKASALRDIKTVKWVPGAGEARITAMVENRPEWCISRQRLWGVPIPVFYCTACENVVVTKDVQESVLDKISRHGTDIWFEKEADFFIPKGTSCPHCKGTAFKKEKDILDVWFDSGVSHQAVLKENSLLEYPCDLYLEGSDQHRGWFQSALLTAKAIGDEKPFKAVLTHGFVVDGEGRKMSKSLGNVVDPLKVLEKYGADILRLWVASMNYFVDIRISEDILSQISDAYRKIRNTFRFLLGNCSDFDFKKNAVPQEKMKDIDLYILSRYAALLEDSREFYDNYEFHRVYRSIYQFCTVDLSSFYLDIMKNKLYTDYFDSPERRSAQTAMHIMAEGLCKIISPLLPFTADEIWEHFQKNENPESVHLAQWPEFFMTKDVANLEDKYVRLIDVRNVVLVRLEEARNKKLIGSALEAKVSIAAGDEELYRLLQQTDPQELRELLIVSGVELSMAEKGSPLSVAVSKADGKKCVRCWQYKTSVGTSSVHKDICTECMDVVKKLKQT
ncbi:MAG: isoleucine--tRNA ligase [Candidatus Aureabacteria bacterium]|nr:isoleucine--tRNA ligase [Candidatus Auribacterota bacterium]